MTPPGEPHDEDDLLRSLASMELALTRLRPGEGDARGGARRGGRVEFAGHRAYAPGDDVRTIDWAAHARTGRLHVKEFERDEDLQLLLVVDTSASMELHGKLRCAQRIAYALGWVALRSGGTVRVAAAADGGLDVGDGLTGAPGSASLRSALARLRAGRGTDLGASLARVPAAARGPRLVLVLSDLLAELDAGRSILPLLERGDDVALVRVHAVADADPAPPEDDDPGDTVLEDAETGERVRLDAASSERARRATAARAERWREFAARHGVRYLSVDAGAPVGVATVAALRAAGILA